MSLDSHYTWDSAKEAPSYRASRNGSFGWWVLVAVVVAVFLHVVALWLLGRTGIVFELSDLEWRSETFRVAAVDPIPESAVVPPVEEEVEAPPKDSAELLTELEELLPELDDMELDILPEIDKPKVSLEPLKPAALGEVDGQLLEPIKAPEVKNNLAELGRGEPIFTEVPEGRVVIERGEVSADIPDPDEYLKDAAMRGAGGLDEAGFPDGYTALGNYINMDVDQLDKGRAALPSDLLFEFNSAELKQGARLGLMKLAILIDRNPQMFCILEGHTDTFGEDEYNLRLSRQRAEAVRDWLIKALRLDGQQIVVRAYGESKARLPEGDKDEQAINRRVDILMRKELPPEEPVLIKPSRAVPVPTPVPTSEARPLETPSPRAVPVGEPAVPVGERAVPVEEDPPRAVPAEPARAQPVE